MQASKSRERCGLHRSLLRHTDLRSSKAPDRSLLVVQKRKFRLLRLRRQERPDARLRESVYGLFVFRIHETAEIRQKRLNLGFLHNGKEKHQRQRGEAVFSAFQIEQRTR